MGVHVTLEFSRDNQDPEYTLSVGDWVEACDCARAWVEAALQDHYGDAAAVTVSLVGAGGRTSAVVTTDEREVSLDSDEREAVAVARDAVLDFWSNY